MPDWFSTISIAEYTPATLAIIAGLLVLFGKLVPSKTMATLLAFYKDALDIERENSRRSQESVQTLIKQNELVLDILRKLPKPKPVGPEELPKQEQRTNCAHQEPEGGEVIEN